MNWYKKSKKAESGKMSKTACIHKIEKTAAPINKDKTHISEDRKEEFIYITANRIHETSYYVQITHRQIDNSNNEPYWAVIITAFSFEVGNIVYKKCIYHRKKSDADKNYEKSVRIIKELRQEQEANNIPTATIPSMIWYALHDIEGDLDLKPRGSGNILYLRQNHNIDANKGNLFKNILFLDKANTNILEVEPRNVIPQQKNRF